jgi:hypothetical protein
VREQRAERDELVDRLTERVAEMTEEPALVARVVQAAVNGQWRASAWLLERRYPERWAPKTRTTDDVRPHERTPHPFAEVDELARRRRERYDR